MTTLLQIREFALARADMQHSNFRDTTQLNYMINKSAEELYDILVSRFEDYYSKSVEFNIAPGNDGYLLAQSIYKLRGVDYSNGGTWITLHPFTFEERNRGNRYGANLLANRRYRWMGQDFKVMPPDQAAGKYRLWYIPRFTDMVTDSDVLDFNLEQWVDYIVVDVGIKLLQQEESDTAVLMAQKAGLMARITSMASNRDAGSPETITDSRRDWDDDRDGFYRGY